MAFTQYTISAPTLVGASHPNLVASDPLYCHVFSDIKEGTSVRFSRSVKWTRPSIAIKDLPVRDVVRHLEHSFEFAIRCGSIDSKFPQIAPAIINLPIPETVTFWTMTKFCNDSGVTRGVPVRTSRVSKEDGEAPGGEAPGGEAKTEWIPYQSDEFAWKKCNVKTAGELFLVMSKSLAGPDSRIFHDNIDNTVRLRPLPTGSAHKAAVYAIEFVSNIPSESLHYNPDALVDSDDEDDEEED